MAANRYPPDTGNKARRRELEADLIRLGEQFRKHGLLLVAAESCTGGWIGKLCSDITGSSRWFEASIVAYSNRSKHDLLGVATDTLSDCGAVSKEVVLAMADGALERVASANISVAVSGIAGPGGGTPRTPVGTVWVAWRRRGHESVSRRFHFQGDRDAVRFGAARAALSGLSDPRLLPGLLPGLL